jgi:hypothetical protein
MTKSTTSCFPDINVWLAIVVDAYLAAYGAVNGATLVTFDKGFARYPVSSLILELNEMKGIEVVILAVRRLW